jgi:hypothetical protein
MDPLVKEALDNLGRELARATKRTELRGILKLCRVRGELINYVDIAKALGMFSGGTELATILGELMKEAHDAGEPPLSALVVRTDTGMPGDGFFSYARQLGYEFTSGDDHALPRSADHRAREPVARFRSGSRTFRRELIARPAIAFPRKGVIASSVCARWALLHAVSLRYASFATRSCTPDLSAGASRG